MVDLEKAPEGTGYDDVAAEALARISPERLKRSLSG